MRIEFLDPKFRTEEAVQYWSNVIRRIRQDNNMFYWGPMFEEWLLEHYNIKTLHESIRYPGYITGYEMPDEIETFLRLKYADKV